MKKLLAIATTLTLLLTFTIPVLADDNMSNINQTPTSQSSPTDKTTKAKERLQTEITKLQNQGQFQQYMGPVRDLQKQEVQIREQIGSIRNQVHQQLKSDRHAKNYTALLAALNDMTTMQDDIADVETISKTCLTDWQQYHSDRQAKNVQSIQADLQKLQGDIQAKISAMQKVLADLQKVSQDLNIPAATPATTPTPAPATNQTTPAPTSTTGNQATPTL